MLLTLGLILLIVALADLVARFNGPVKKEPVCTPHHDWYQMVDTEGNDLSLICGTCKKTPTMISEEHIPRD